MKRLNAFCIKSLLLSLVLVTGSCSEDDKENGKDGDATLLINPDVTAIQFSADGMKAVVTSSHSTSTPAGTQLTSDGAATFTVSTNQSSWSVTQPTGSWVHVDKANNSFKVSVDENTSTNGRTPVKLTVRAGDATPVTLDILQPEADPAVSINPLVSKVMFSADSKTATVATAPEGSPVSAGDILTGESQLTIAVITNQPAWTSEKVPDNENSAWLSVNHTGINEITVATVHNDSKTAREDVQVRIRAGTAVYTLTFGQYGINTDLAQVETIEPQASGPASVTVGGNITHEGIPAYTLRGVCWSGSSNEPVISSDTHIFVAGIGTGRFTTGLYGLEPGTYYIRAFAVNEAGTAYGASHTFVIAEAEGLAQVTTTEPAEIGQNSARLGGSIIQAGNPAYTERGVCWATWEYPTVNTNKQVIAGSGTGNFSATVSGLQPNTIYYVRAYATSASGTAYGEQRSFSTGAIPTTLPVLTTLAATDIGTHSATTGVHITDAGYPVYSQSGVCYSTTQNPTISGSKVFASYSGEPGSFTVQLNELVPDVTWYARAYAFSDAGVAYGQQISFTTLREEISWPELTTTAAGTITANSAVLGGNVSNAGNPPYTERGVCYSITENPTIQNNKLQAAGAGTGAFSVTATDLSPGTTYYIRAYAICEGTPVYGQQIQFTTLQEETSWPELTTTAAGTITANSAVLGGNITNAGNPPYTERGVCYSITENPTIQNNKLQVAGAGTGAFSVTATNLSSGTTYYVRAYAICEGTPVYGNQIQFTTSLPQGLPVLTTLSVTDIGTNSARMGGNISDPGTPAYTERGICWSVAPEPTVSHARLQIEGTGTGAFSALIQTALAPGETYYVRAYAINQGGTAYGNTVSFTTLASPSSPIILTGPSNVTGDFDLTWTFTWPEIGSTTDHYELEYSANNGTTWDLLARYGNGVRTSPFTDRINVDGSDAGKAYSFRVKAMANGLFTDYSNVIHVQVGSVSTTASIYATYDNLLMRRYSNTSVAATNYPASDLAVGNNYMYGPPAPSDYLLNESALFFNIASFQGKTIEKAILRLYPETLATDYGTTYSIAPFGGSWTSSGAGGICYNNKPGHVASRTVTKAPPVSGIVWEVDITSIVQAWANGTLTNHGLRIWDANYMSSITYNAYRATSFHSLESTTAAWRPQLYIESR